MSSGYLSISRRELARGSPEKLDPDNGRVVERDPAPSGIGGIAFDSAGGLWGASEAGACHFPLRYSFFPVIFRFDLDLITPAARYR